MATSIEALRRDGIQPGLEGLVDDAVKFLSEAAEDVLSVQAGAIRPEMPAPAPAPPAPDCMDVDAQPVTAALAALDLPIDIVLANSSPVSQPLLRIAQLAAAKRTEAGEERSGAWKAPEPELADRLIKAFRERCLPLTTSARLRKFLAKVLSCKGLRISKRYAGESALGNVNYQGQYASEANLAALASELEAFVWPFATLLQARVVTIEEDGRPSRQGKLITCGPEICEAWLAPSTSGYMVQFQEDQGSTLIAGFVDDRVQSIRS